MPSQGGSIGLLLFGFRSFPQDVSGYKKKISIASKVLAVSFAINGGVFSVGGDVIFVLIVGFIIGVLWNVFIKKLKFGIRFLQN